jgi:hypothetical protein
MHSSSSKLSFVAGASLPLSSLALLLLLLLLLLRR